MKDIVVTKPQFIYSGDGDLIEPVPAYDPNQPFHLVRVS